MKAPLRYWVTVFAMQGLIAASILGVSVWQWHLSWLPLALFVGFTVLPLLFYATIGAVALDPTKKKDAIVKVDSPSLGVRVRVTLIPLLLAAAVYCGLIASFLIPSVRSLIVEEAAAARWSLPAEQALLDPSPEVRETACQTIQTHSASLSTPVLLEALSVSEDLDHCIMPAISFGGDHPVLAWRQAQWSGTLMSSDLRGEEMCQMASHLFHADRVGAPSALMQLFTCATGAKSPQARECCTQTLTSIRQGEELTAFLPTPEAVLETNFTEHLGTYIRATFDESSNIQRLSSPSLESWAIELACLGAQRHTQRTVSVRDVFPDAISTDSCTAPVFDANTIPIWRDTCQEWLDAPFPLDEFCPTLLNRLEERAFITANVLVAKAVHSAEVAQRPEKEDPLFRNIKLPAGFNSVGGRNKSPYQIDMSSVNDMLNSLANGDALIDDEDALKEWKRQLEKMQPKP